MMVLTASILLIGPSFISAGLLIPSILFMQFQLSSVNNEIVYEASRGLMQKLALEAIEVAMVMTEAWIVQGEAGKVICKEAERIKPAAVVIGTRGRSLMQSVPQGSVSEYCFHNCKSAPVVIVPGKEAGDESLI